MKIGEYQIGVDGSMGHYNCTVEEIHDNGETFYQVSIKAPYLGNDNKAPILSSVEMHFDSESGGLKIKDVNGNLPNDVRELEDSLSDLICGIHN